MAIRLELTNDAAALLGIAAAMLVMAGSSIGTEVLYQRYLWVLLGIGLAANPHQLLDEGLKHVRKTAVA